MLQTVLNKSTGLLMEMLHLLINPKYKELWGKLYTKEVSCLAQGIPVPGVSKGTNTIIFIMRDEIPADGRCDTTYARVCINYRPEKDDPNRTQLTVGSNLIHVLGNVSTPTVNMVTVKLHLNIVISTKGARYCTIDLKDFYLNTPMVHLEYMRMKLKDIPPKFVKIYDLEKLRLPMALTTSRSRRACTASHRLASLPRIYSENDSTNMATIKALPHRASGNTIGAPSPSPSALTTSS
jgi:hypothetical protein